MEISRRELLKLLGVSSGAAAGGLWGASQLLSVPDHLFERVLTGPRLESWKTSVCSQCAGGCGIKVRLIDGIPVRVLGNPFYPVNRGAVCPMAEAGIEELFHPDRIRKPLLRIGNKRDFQWKETTWEEAEGILVSRLRDLRTQGGAHRLVALTRDNNDLMAPYLGRFLEVFGSPNYFCLSDSRIATLPVQLTQGLQSPPLYDLANTQHVLNFGAELLDDGPSPIRLNQIYGDLRSRKQQSGTRITHVSSYMSRTASNSSDWVPVKPGTGAALALSIAYVMVNDGTYDRTFVKDHCQGFSSWRDTSGHLHDGFQSLVASYYPERVSDLTGVPAEKIVEVARSFAAARPALAIAGKEIACATNGLYSLWAIYCLNALKGNLGVRGGVLFPTGRMVPSLPEKRLDEVASEGLRQPRIGAAGNPDLSVRVDSLSQLISGLRQSKPYKVDTLLVYRTNPLLESTDHDQCLAALQKVPFLVCCTSFMDETAREADLILPEPAFLERWEISLNNPGVEFGHFGVQHPLVETSPETSQLGDGMLRIAKELGETVAAAFPWDSYESYLKSYAQQVFESEAGTIVSGSVELSWIQFLKERGWRAFDYSNFEEFWDVLLEQGGWWNPVDPTEKGGPFFKTRSGKFEFYAQSLKEELGKGPDEAFSLDQVRSLMQSWKIEASGDLMFLPHFETPRFHQESLTFPLHLIVYPLLTNINGRASHLAILREMSGLQSHHYWDSWVEINPETAARFGLEEADLVDIISPRGRLTVVAKIVPTVMPETVVMPWGVGQASFAQFGKHQGTSPFSVFVEETDPMTGIASLISTRVRIEQTNRARTQL